MENMKFEIIYFQDFFTENNLTIESLRKHFKRNCKKYHSDLGGDDKIFIAMNNEYMLIFEYIETYINKVTDDQLFNNLNIELSLKIVLNELIKLDNIEIEIVGSWLWVSGDTKQYKEIFKNLHLRWSNPKKCWYYFNNIENSKKIRAFAKNLDEIRSKYTSTKVNKPEKFKQKLN